MLVDDDGDEGPDASKNSTQVRPAPRMSQGAQALRYLQRGSIGGDLLQKAATFVQNAKLVEAQQGKQRKRDRRITRMQRKTLRDKKQALAKVPRVASLKSLRAQEMKAFIQERRVIWEDANPNRVRGSSERIEHPAVNGYALQPVPSQWDPRKQSPIYFGSLEQQKANCTYVEVDLKIFGISLEDWGPKFQAALERTIWTLIPVHFHVPPCAVKVVFTEEVAGENLRRVAEKVERRAQNHKAFREHLANLVREDGGVINVKLHVGIHATAEAIEQCGRYRVPVPGQDDATLARRLMTLDIPSQELLKARKVANDLAKELTKGTMQSTLQSSYSSDKAFSLAHNHVPKPNKSLKSQDYSLPADTPRKRQTNARKLFFNVGKLLATGKPCDADDDVSEVNHRADFEFADTSQSRFIHPSFCQRKIAHVRPDPRTVNPIFWGQWSQPQIRDYALRNEKKAPAWNSVQKRVHPSFVCDERDYTLEDTVLHFSSSSRDVEGTDAKRRHPMFSGYVRCGPDHNQLDHEAEERRRASEAAEAEDDEAFVASLARRNNRSRRRRHDEEEEMRIKKWIEQTKKRNIHPATRGYRTRLVPLYAKNLAQRLHPSCFGYETGECQVLPTYRVTRVIHPACVGYELVAQEPHIFTGATAKLLNPMFHGLSLRKGPRYEPPIADNDTMTKRRYFLEGLTSNPVKESVPLCVVCFGENSVGCPRCWTPGAWEISGTKLDDLASDITKTIAQNPILNRNGGRARRKIAMQNTSPGAQNSSDADTKCESKKAKRFKLKMAAMTALVDTTRLLSVADIRTYRSTKSNFVTVFIKSLPTGEVTRLTVDATSTVRDLYFLYRSNARRDVALLPRFWLVVPMLSGLMCLDETRQIHDEMNCAFEPGKLTLEEYGLFKKNGEVCLFQIKDLYHPQAATIVRKYIEANVNLARKLDIEEMEEVERQESELPGKRRVRSKFEEDTTSSVSIKTRINAMRVANGRDEAVDGPAGQSTASLLHAEIMKEIHFELLFRPDQLPPPVPEQPYTPPRFNVANDALQLPLVREMRDVMIRQKRAWKEHIVEREEVIKKARDAKLAHAIEVRKMAKASSDERGGRRKRTKVKKIPKKPFLGPSVPRSSPGPRQVPRLPILCSRSIVLTDDA